ncbi:MAG: chorismate mutase [Anaerolineales bacterium]|nr:chorismate mutase [Anaerolineales bacterium]
MATRGIRGAINVYKDTPAEISTAIDTLFATLIEKNAGLTQEDVGSILITVTHDIRSAFPAKAIREMGWQTVPMMCAQEIPVEGSLPLCIRVLVHWNTDLPQNKITHIYLREATKLRPELAEI